ncbi:MAG TPA: AsmA-like C-terminal region-containing protein [Candidatus Margulisiibacteriota bacterium]|nr:AsmA-like C-terminal region-containing protein [Candidatus Margulisiibacteriota bacterium]
MKKLLWILGVAAGLAGALLAIAAYSANSLVERFKPDIERTASHALHASVSLGALSVSVFPSIKVHVGEARVSQPGSTEALSLKRLVLHVKLLPLLARRLVIETVSLEAPVMTVVRTKEGMFVEGFPRPHPAAPPRRPAAAGPAAAPAASPVRSGLSIDLRRFEIRDATFTLRAADGTEQSVQHINLTTALSAAGDTEMVSSLALRADLPKAGRVSASGTGQSFNLATGDIGLGDLKVDFPGGAVTLGGAANLNSASGDITIASDGIKLDEVMQLAAPLAPALSDVKLGGTVKPDLKATFAAAAYSASGTIELRDVAVQHGTLALTKMAGVLLVSGNQNKQSVATNHLSFMLQDKPAMLSFSAAVEGDTVRVAPFTLTALSGSMSGTVEGALAPPHRFAARVDGSGFSVAELIALADPRTRLQMEGVISKLALNVRGQGMGDIARSLDGTAGFGMKHGVLKGFNLAAAVLTAAKRVPLLAGGVADEPRFKRYFSSKDTEIESLSGDFTVHSGWAETRNLRMESEPLTLAASGRVSFASEVNLAATVTLNPELSQVMIGGAKELRPVLNDDGTLSIPVSVEGRPPNLEARPDVTKLIEASTRNVLKETLGKALNGGETKGGKLLDRLFGK